MLYTYTSKEQTPIDLVLANTDQARGALWSRFRCQNILSTRLSSGVRLEIAGHDVWAASVRLQSRVGYRDAMTIRAGSRGREAGKKDLQGTQPAALRSCEGMGDRPAPA